MAELLSIVKVIERDFGGIWTYDVKSRSWKAIDGREIRKERVDLTKNKYKFVLYTNGSPEDIIIKGTPLSIFAWNHNK